MLAGDDGTNTTDTDAGALQTHTSAQSQQLISVRRHHPFIPSRLVNPGRGLLACLLGAVLYRIQVS